VVAARRRLARPIAYAVLSLTRPITHRRTDTDVARRSADRNAVAARCCAPGTLRCTRVTDIEKIWLPPHTQKPLRHPDGWLAGTRATRTSLSTSLKTSTRTTRGIARDDAAIHRAGRALISRPHPRGLADSISCALLSLSLFLPFREWR